MKTVCFLLGLFPGLIAKCQSIDPVSLLVAKAIQVIDIKVQRLQNETLVLQRLQQAAERKLSQIQLQEIQNREKGLTQLYQDYFNELRLVKSVFASVSNPSADLYRQLLELEAQVPVSERVPAGQCIQRGKAAYQSLLVVLRNGVAMTDAQRLEALHSTETILRQSVAALNGIREKGQTISAQAQQRKLGLQSLKKLYGIP